jgi:Ni,Fe-hydrogenase III small subunit
MNGKQFWVQTKLEQVAIRTVTWIRIALLLIVLGCLTTYAVRGAEPTIENTRPPPRAFFAVMQCDELVAG